MLVNIFKQFFLLGCLSFGGPAAHLGYFKQRFVDQLKWLTAEEYGQIVALSQFLPGPGSSQAGFAIGYKMAGVFGGIAAFIAFTTPSVVLMLLLAIFGAQFFGTDAYNGIVHGLKLLAVVVVADAVYSMFNSFCKKPITQGLFVMSAVFTLLFSGILVQMGILIAAAIIGMFWLKTTISEAPALDSADAKLSFKYLSLVLFLLLFVGLPFLSQQHVFADHVFPVRALINIASDFYLAGSLVFGGGHVVLPMLQNMLENNIANDTFITGYAAAQAVPGPMFTLATYLGYQASPTAPILGALTATFAIFLPGFLLVIAVFDHWQKIGAYAVFHGVVTGVNAAVTGLLLAALYDPVFSSAVVTNKDMLLVFLGIFMMKSLKLPILVLVGFFSAAGLMMFLI